MVRNKLTAIALTAALAAPGLSAADGNAISFDRSELLGSVIGASVGALLGSQVGDGDNELLGAALGGVGGYFVGKRYSNDGYYRGRSRFDHHRPGDRHYRDRHDNGHRYDRHSGRRSHEQRFQGRGPRIDVIDRPYRARVNSHVRSGPAPGYRSVDILRRGERVRVVGRVVGTNWYLVAWSGRVKGYVYAPLLDPARRHSYRDRR